MARVRTSGGRLPRHGAAALAVMVSVALVGCSDARTPTAVPSDSPPGASPTVTSPAAGSAVGAGSESRSVSGAEPGAGSPSAASERCRDGEIAAAVLPDAGGRRHQAWKGVWGMTLSFTNVGRRTCWLFGHPGVAFYDAGSLVSSGSVPAGSSDAGIYTDSALLGAERVTLRPGAVGYAEIVWWAGGLPGEQADPVSDLAVDEVGVIAPDQTRQGRVPVQAMIRKDADRRTVEVTPVTAILDPSPGPGPAPA